MRNILFFILATGLLLFLGCPDIKDKLDDCKLTNAGTCYPDAPVPNQLIITLRPWITDTSMLSGPADTFYVCPLLNDSFSIDRIPTGCDGEVQVITGKQALKDQLNDVLFPNSNDTIQTIFIEKACNCDLVLLSFTAPPVPDIEEKTAKASSEAEEQNNGLFGSIGTNYNIIPEPAGGMPVPPYAGKPEKCNRIYFFDSRLGVTDSLRAIGVRNADPSSKVCVTKIVDIAPIKNPTSTVKVAIVDTGVDPNYEVAPGQKVYTTQFDYSDEVWSENMTVFPLNGSGSYGAMIAGNNMDENSNCLPNDYFGYDFFGEDNNPSDRKGHGTHIAGTILSGNITENNIRVMPIQFGGYKGTMNFSCDLFSGLCGINYAANNGADIINLSWGYYSPYTNGPLKAQLQLAADNDVLVVASVGNDSVNVTVCQHWPSNFVDTLPDNIITVTALDTFTATDVNNNQYRIASFANVGSQVDIAAPGTDIDSWLVSSGKQTIELSGTSMAAAVISRRAAMLKNANASLTAKQLKSAILQETVSVPEVCTKGNRVYDIKQDTSLPNAIGY